MMAARSARLILAQAPDPNSVTPGVLGFLVVFVLAIATWLLMRNMTGHLRRLRFREEQRLAAEAGDAQDEDAQATARDPDDGPPAR